MTHWICRRATSSGHRQRLAVVVDDVSAIRLVLACFASYSNQVLLGMSLLQGTVKESTSLDSFRVTISNIETAMLTYSTPQNVQHTNPLYTRLKQTPQMNLSTTSLHTHKSISTCLPRYRYSTTKRTKYPL
jgi:hypothetical protein